MWRRRRGDARRGGWEPRSSWVLARRRGRSAADRVRPADRPAPAPVTLTVPPELARIPATAGAAPAAAPQGMKGRLSELMPSVYCTACGEANPDGSRFCAHCGTPLVRLSGDRFADTTSTIAVPG